MYAEYFNLDRQPFNDGYDPRVYCSRPEHEEILASLIYATGELKGMLLLTGEAGTGKTLLARQMRSHFEDRIAYAELRRDALDTDDVLVATCTAFGVVPDPDQGASAPLNALRAYLMDQFAANRPCVLILDDAHLMSPNALVSLCQLNNIESGNVKLLQIVLIGQPELCTTLAEPALRPLRQRCFRTCRLGAMSRAQTEAYIQHRLRVAGAEQVTIFSKDAVDAIFNHSRGIPRLVNTVCDNVMLSAYASDAKEITSAFIGVVANQTMMLRDTLDFTGAPAMPPPPPPNTHETAPASAPVVRPAAAPPPEVARPTDRVATVDAIVATRLAAIEGKISGLIAFNPANNLSVHDLEQIVGRRLVSLEQRVAGALENRPAPVRDRVRAEVSERLSDVERKIDRFGRSGCDRDRRNTNLVRDLRRKIETELARSRKLADRKLDSLKLEVQKRPVAVEPDAVRRKAAEVTAARLAINSDNHPPADPIEPTRSPDLPVSPPPAREPAPPRAEAPQERETADVSAKKPRQPKRTSTKAPSTPAEPSSTRRLLDSVQKLGRLVDQVTHERGLL